MANPTAQSCMSETQEIDYLNLSADEEESINIGLVGDVGSGRSCFVNAIVRHAAHSRYELILNFKESLQCLQSKVLG